MHYFGAQRSLTNTTHIKRNVKKCISFDKFWGFLFYHLSPSQILYLQGIPKLLKLMQNDSEELQRAAVSSLRNIVFENNENKMEVKDCEGLPVILRLLKMNRDIETRRQLTGKQVFQYTVYCIKLASDISYSIFFVVLSTKITI